MHTLQANACECVHLSFFVDRSHKERRLGVAPNRHLSALLTRSSIDLRIGGSHHAQVGAYGLAAGLGRGSVLVASLHGRCPRWCSLMAAHSRLV